jgi:hypothetical protein
MAMGELTDRQKAAFAGLVFAVFWAVFREAVHAHDDHDKMNSGSIAVESALAFLFGLIVPDVAARKRRR